MRYREFDQAELEKHYNPRIAVPDFQKYLDEKQAKSETARASLDGLIDIRFGDGSLETLDVFGAQKTASAEGTPLKPMHIFVHGGYWRGLDKHFYSYLAPPFVQSGCIFVATNYDLCPTVTLDTVVEQTVRAIAFCHAHAKEWGADPARITLSGHSAGAHLAAAALQADWSLHNVPSAAFRGAALVSGIYDLAPVLRATVNSEIGLTEDVASRQTLLGKKMTVTAPVLIAAGGAEPSDWIAQSLAFAEHCNAAGLSTGCRVMAGKNHFSITTNLDDPGAELTKCLLEQAHS